ncbi:hypothetical protein [Sporosarcina sp. SAFN-015]|uniref:hypothetical protein n=1 Tax=Sporosarcina sp. SAFN-015 TaxID=3387274 RepID=UPI003F7DED5C
MSKKQGRKKQVKKELYIAEYGQNEHFFFIAGFTEGGVPYGITWEEAFAHGLVEEDAPSGVNDTLPF